MEMWFSEFHTPDVKHSIRVDRQLYSKQSAYQRIDIFETPEFGRVLTLDGNVMLTERDEFIYDEMITHVPMSVHRNAKDILVIGAGDGGVCHPQPFQRKAQYLCPAWHYLVGHEQAFAVHTRCDAAALAARRGAYIQHPHTRVYLRCGNRRHGRGFLNIEQSRYVVRIIAYAVRGLIEHKALLQYFGTLNFISKQAFQLLRACL